MPASQNPHARIVILTALESELNAADAPPGVEVVYCGVGKVNAALHTTRRLLAGKPELVINFGTAGKIDPLHDGLLEVAAVVQRDMLAMPLAPRGVTPLASETEQPARLESGYPGVVCGTGDSFVTAADDWLLREKIDLVDMELFAIARVCRHFGVPWRAFKFITDGADDDSASDWQDKVHLGAELFWRHLPLVVGR
ncbi:MULTISPECIES: 5'-methylthioadenosine nucleosidase [unclassified Herbaspirillum]|uniref:phosphorylase family protein n=1 Tax=unclassified Herbaspirillum TaxID=2624150 RepID=UPI001153B0E9|nr:MULTISPECIES: 5'-methylthioadenosine nucleosidase [unclassified Herbaspirillum]MBB5390153.1 adenosylhomocysteine nucleosidase [Herbaspirillum sp. SJZ102]TQK09348.1 adenosylhomocysteine nucleosidase [Herbaspirillum sp. SJZ130]TQK13965.1 adenosylhomocysteine nucleosidase [Herbaspirillum sp. SJZ106]TWC69690.1 adenosylhomocysteine nucleosidase [Herbaspirillum sp. SJZ099]